MISVRLLDTDIQIEQKVNKALAEHINSTIRKRKGAVLSKFKSTIRNWIMGQPEIKSLMDEGGAYSLHSLFGIYKGSSGTIIDIIVDAIVSSTRITINPVDKNLRGSLLFQFQPKDFVNLLSLSAGKVITKKGVSLHWMDWLLNQGDKVIVVGYRYFPSRGGRSGGGRMDKGYGFRVPPQFSGTRNDNFVTRAFSNREIEITQIISRIFS